MMVAAERAPWQNPAHPVDADAGVPGRRRDGRYFHALWRAWLAASTGRAATDRRATQC